MTLKVDGGWVTEASVEDVKLLPGVHRTMFRLQGGEWVTREIVPRREFRPRRIHRSTAATSSGGAIRALTIDDSPYWKRVNETLLTKLPPPDDAMRAAGLDGRWFLGVGNHEVWGDPKIEGTLSAVPYLKDLGVTPENLHLQIRLQGRPLHLSLDREV